MRLVTYLSTKSDIRQQASHTETEVRRSLAVNNTEECSSTAISQPVKKFSITLW